MRVERFWILGNLVYSAFRVVLAWRFLSERGLSVFWFATVEVLSAVPWALATSRLFMALATRQRRTAWWWTALATAAFLAPDAYVIGTTHHVPLWIYLIIGTWITVAATLGIRRVTTSVTSRLAVDASPRTRRESPPSQR